ncbi:MAG TPA: carboxypeptidase-like regulatory domain-containing protein, partial [Planctomycetota bacterium]|nr:carboxypeptidase-like regulatory domain-containing protein [Planctomycetota bacterium]
MMRKAGIIVALLVLAGAALVLLRAPGAEDPAAARAPEVLHEVPDVAERVRVAASVPERPAAAPAALVASVDRAAGAEPAPQAMLQVLLLDANQEPVAGAALCVLDLAAGGTFGAPVASLRTDAAGRAQGPVPAGTLRVELRVPLIEHDLGVVAAGETRAVTLLYPRAAMLQGMVSAGGRALAGAVVSVRRPTRSASTTTDAAGRYELGLMGGMPDTVCARSPLGGLVVRALQVPPGATVTADLEFGSGTLAGKVIDRITGEGVPGVKLQLSRPPDPRLGSAVMSDDLGRFSLGDVADGEWSLSLSGGVSDTEPL